MRLLFIKVKFVSDTSSSVEAYVQANDVRSVFDSPNGGGSKITFTDGTTIRINESAHHFVMRLAHLHPKDIEIVEV